MMQQIQKEGPPPLRKLNAKVPPDLETIIHKAISREPGRRYATARAFAEDLGRFVEGLPILARRSSLADRLGRWCRRNPWIAASIAALSVGIAISIWQAIRATTAERLARIAQASTRRERNRAESQAQMYAAVNEFLNQDLLAQASPDNQVQPGTQARPRSQGQDRTRSRRRKDRCAIRERASRRGLDPADNCRDLPPARAFSASALACPAGIDLRLSTLGVQHHETLKTKLLTGSIYLSDGKLPRPSRSWSRPWTASRPRPRPSDSDCSTQCTASRSFILHKASSLKLSGYLIQVREAYALNANATPLETISATNTLAMVYEAQKKSDLAKPAAGGHGQ